MSKYDSETFEVFCFFSKTDLSLKSSRDFFNIFLSDFISEFDLHFKQKGFYKNPNVLYTKPVRQTNLKKDLLNHTYKEIKGITESQTYIFDKDWNKENPPKILVVIAELEERYKKLGLNSFFISAINNQMNGKEYEFYKSNFDKLNGIKGGIIKRTKYNIDKTYVEWSYKNFPIEIERNGIENWNPGFDTMFEKNTFANNV